MRYIVDMLAEMLVVVLVMALFVFLRHWPAWLL
jgi:hypothetical protein